MLKPEMAPNYDISLRNIFAVGAVSFLRSIDLVVDAKLDTDVSKIAKRNVDMLRERSGEIVHLEFQRSHDPQMRYRMLDYAGAILAALTLQDNKYFSYKLRQTLIHVGRSETPATVVCDWGSARIEYRSVGTLDVALDTCSEWDGGDAAISIICRNGNHAAVIQRALKVIHKHEKAPELLGCYLSLAMAVPGALEQVIIRNAALGAEIDLKQIPQFRDYVDARLGQTRREKSEQFFWEIAGELFPGEPFDEGQRVSLEGLSSTMIDLARKSLKDYDSLSDALAEISPGRGVVPG